jgi:zinc transporter, ZIP family
MSPLAFAFLMTLLAGLATGVGGLIAVSTRRGNTAFLAVALAFSAGAMLYVSFVEILPKASASLAGSGPGSSGIPGATIGFFAGIAVVMIVNQVVSRLYARRQSGDDDLAPGSTGARRRLARMGVLIAVVVALHNFPEGLATFLVLLEDPEVGVAIAIAIAIHNIPEGIAIAAPIHEATGSRRRAIVMATASGLAEPVGAIAGYAILRPFITDGVFGMVFAAVAGVMVFISIHELFPAARQYGRPLLATNGAIAGMFVMAASLLLLQA